MRPRNDTIDDEHEEEDEEEEYDENADDDFNPDKLNAEENVSSSSEDESEKTAEPKTKRTKRKSEIIDEGLDSGDEATIKEQKRRKRRKEAAENEESGGEGGFVRTRAQRQAEKEERKHRKRARDGEVTVDVDQLWEELISVPIGKVSLGAPQPADEDVDVDDKHGKESVPAPEHDDMITIKRRVEYAGAVEEMEERVPRSSKEAQKYLAEHPEADPRHRMHEVDSSGLQRPFKRASMFEPNPLSVVKGVAPEKLRPRAPTRMDVLMAQKREEEKKRAQKLSTVQKSAADWKGFVDKEGLKDELDEYGKSRRGFLAREAFLDRAAGAREQRARDARLKV